MKIELQAIGFPHTIRKNRICFICSSRGMVFFIGLTLSVIGQATSEHLTDDNSNSNEINRSRVFYSLFSLPGNTLFSTYDRVVVQNIISKTAKLRLFTSTNRNYVRNRISSGKKQHIISFVYALSTVWLIRFNLYGLLLSSWKTNRKINVPIVRQFR